MPACIAYGGTFDPIHCGHLAVAIAVRDWLGEPVRLVPAADPPHKSATHADAATRLLMVELAIAHEPGLIADPRELARDSPSYTVDTLDALRAEIGPDLPLVWVIGADSLAQLHRWHRWRALFAFGHVLAVGRPGFSLDPAGFATIDPSLAAELLPRVAPLECLLQSPNGHLSLLEMDPPRRESSTEIRRRIGCDERWEDDVPPAVGEYIVRHRLYAPGAAA